MSATLPVGTPARAGDYCVDGSLGVTGTTSTKELTVADLATIKDIKYTGDVFTGTSFAGTQCIKIDIGGAKYKIQLTPDT